MMKIIFTLLFFLVSSASFSQANDIRAFHTGDYDRKSIVDRKIRNIRVSSSSNNQKSLSFHFQFDSSGLAETETISNAKDEKQSEFQFFYNSNGHLVKRINKSFETNKILVDSFMRVYENNNPVQHISSASPFIYRHFYNAQKQKTKTIIYFNQDTARAEKRILIFNYDDKGYLNSTIEYAMNTLDSEMWDIDSSYYVRDSNGRVIKFSRTNGAEFSYTYDEQGLLNTVTIQTGKGLNNNFIIEEYSYEFWE